MINYIWLAFIVLAVAYAGFHDLSGKPPIERPDKVMIMTFEEAEEVTSGTLERDVVGREGQSLALPYESSEPGRQTLEIGLVLKPRDFDSSWSKKPVQVDPREIRFFLLGDGSRNSAYITATDADGELFRLPEPYSLSNTAKWTRVIVALADLEPDPANPGAEIDLPAEMQVEVAVSARSAATAGTVHVDDFEAHYKEVRQASDDFESNSWMGVATSSAANWAGLSIQLAINLIGVMMLWLGLMKIAEQAGLVRVLARAVKPIMVRLFPEIPAESDAMGAMLMNISANMLGLGNAATPLGLKAMKELQELNPAKEYASNAMCMLLSMNTASVTIIPASIIAYRAAAESANLMIFWLPMVLTTICSTIVAIAVCKILEKLPMFRIPASAFDSARIETDEEVNQ